MKAWALAALVLLGAHSPAVAAARDGGADAGSGGELDPALVARAVRTRLGSIKSCYEGALRDKPDLEGRVTIHWTITTAGTTTAVHVEANSFPDRAVPDCIADVVRRWTFPPPTGGSVDVSFPFVFQSAKKDPKASLTPTATKPKVPPPIVRKLRLAGDAELITTLTGVESMKEDQRPHLQLVIQRAGRASEALELELTPAAYPALADVIEPSFLWELGSSVLPLGSRRVARVRLWGRTGEDLMVNQEIALLVGLDDDAPAPKLLWIGLGDRLENQFDTCMIETFATFRMSADGKLERHLRSTKTVDQKAKGTDYEDYLKGCKAPPPKTDTFVLRN